jgi:hypothetical protein
MRDHLIIVSKVEIILGFVHPNIPKPSDSSYKEGTEEILPT